MATIEYIICTDESQQVFIAILVAMQWANENMFISSLVMLHSGEGGKGVGGEICMWRRNQAQ